MVTHFHGGRALSTVLNAERVQLRMFVSAVAFLISVKTNDGENSVRTNFVNKLYFQSVRVEEKSSKASCSVLKMKSRFIPRM